MDAESPTARALLTLALLQASPGITADRLADKLGISARAARRYVATLRDAGVPIDSTTGPYGGYRLGRGVRLPPLTFDSAEALGLVMAVLDGHHDAGDPTNPVGAALAKLMRSLPEPVAAQAEAVRRTTAAAPDRGAARPHPATTSALVEACSAHRRVALDYRSERGTQWTTEVEPWAVVVRHGRWYLLCRSCERDATRAYRIDRVLGVRPLPQLFQPPAALDPVALLEDHLASGWEYPTEVLIEAPLELVERCVPRRLGRLEAVDEHRCRLTGSTNVPDAYAEGLALVPAPFHVVAGPELRAAVAALGRRLLSAAGGDGADEGAPGDDVHRL